MKKFKKILFTILCLTPMIVFASGEDTLSIGEALLMEAFVSIHMTAFVLYPMAKMLAKEGNEKRLAIIFFIIRAAILLFFDFFVTPFIAIADFIGVFVGGFIIVPITGAITKKSNPITSGKIVAKDASGNIIDIAQSTIKNEIQTAANQTAAAATSVVKEPFIYPSHFASMYTLDDKTFLESYIKQELSKIGLEENSKLMPEEILKRKKVFNTIFSILLTAFTCLLFFHFNTYIYVGGVIVLFGFFVLTRRYNLLRYIIKEIKSRPQEKITNILMNIKTNFTEDNSKSILLIGFLAAIIMPVILFMNPRVMYEELDEGYAIRFYTLGIKQPARVEIPETYKGKPVIGIRGNVFANLSRVEEIILPNTITEIRGQAFENSKSLKMVKLPDNLVTLGGGAFRNCTNLISISFPDTTIEIGGEAFLNAHSLREVKLPKNLTEIRGNTFENCESLQFIEIPDTVTRIGGHAFRNCTSLSGVYISKNSQLEEIGSSAFRVCPNLQSITLPAGTYYNERAFKESPTQIYFYEGYEFNQ